ncbi:thioesterase domain-containing protein [Burkholderia arboris]|uniref:thioesterase domain-containing protein n=1 Tax=Burkholderia arboris TaxID=488730 RepID=UPI0030F072EF
MMRTDDIAPRLRASLAQVLGAPLHYGFLAALCRAGVRGVDCGNDATITIRRRSAVVGADPTITLGSLELAGPLRTLVRRVADRLDAAGGAEAGAAIDQWALEVHGAADGPVVLRPHDPMQANAWQVSVAGAPALAAAIGDLWRRAASELADQLSVDPIVDVTRVLAGRAMRDAGDAVLTLIHGADGSVVPFAPLAARLPFRVRAFRGVPAQLAQAADLKDLARRYADALCEIDDRPFHWIGGHSFGAVVAREMAALLEKRGKRLGVVVSLDPSLALAARERASNDRTERITLLKAMFPPAEADRFLAESPSDGDIDARLHRRMPAARLREVLDMRQTCLALLKSHRTVAAPATRVACLHAREPLLPDWHALALQHRVQGIEVPGNHFSMLSEPHVACVASIVQSLRPESCDD